MDVQFFKPFVDGTMNVLSVQCNVKSTPGKPFIKGTQPQPDFDIAAVIGLAAKAFTGSITLCFPKPVFLEIMGNMLGEKFTDITQDLEDGAGELLNIIFGSAKVVLNERGYDIQKAIPNVIRGQKLHTNHMTSAKVVVLPFTTGVGEFHVEISAEGASLS